MIRGLTNMKSESMDLYMAIGPDKLYMRAHEISSGTCRGLFGDLEATRDYRYVSTHSNRQGRWGVDFYLLVLGLTCGFYVNPRFHEESFSAGLMSHKLVEPAHLYINQIYSVRCAFLLFTR